MMTRKRAGQPPPLEPPAGDFGGNGERELDDEEREDDDTEALLVIVATVADMGRWIPEHVVKKHGDRPVWFLLEEETGVVGLFDRYPEGPMDQGTVDAILGGLRAFSLDQSGLLQHLLGVTDTLHYGFHINASLAEVVTSFEDDGFDVLRVIQGGQVVLEEPGL